MKKSFLTAVTLMALAIIPSSGIKAEANNDIDNGKGSGLVVRGDKSAKVSKCYWGNYRKSIEVREDPYRKVSAEFNFAAEFSTGTYVITTFANEHILDGGYTWGSVFIQDEGGSSTIEQGTLELTVTDDYCKLKATGKDDDGKEVTVTWEGPMVKDPSPY
ncbi:MAG: hypothetical protein IJ651_07410 [Bacteroidales bacterium]|nr:hypothetical protein [Bacteroidales bacterium]